MTGSSSVQLSKPSIDTRLPQSEDSGAKLSVRREAVFELLNELAADNAKYMRESLTSNYAQRFADSCNDIYTLTNEISDVVEDLQAASAGCDFDDRTPGNGFRSMICMCDMVVLRLIALLRKCSEARGSRTFRLVHFCKESESYGAVLRFLMLAGRQVVSAVPMLDTGCLFPPLESDYSRYNFVFKGIESLDATCFYGRALGFQAGPILCTSPYRRLQFSPSVEVIFRVIGYALAAFSLTWDKERSAISSLIQSWKMLLSPDEQAARIVKACLPPIIYAHGRSLQVTREANIQFCRAFWNLSELAGPQFYCPTMAVNELREIPLCGPLPLLANSQETVLIPEPSAHTGPRPVRIRVLSAVHRKGLSSSSSAGHGSSPHLVIHCHGGGYVSTSSKAHETYLRYWAKELNCPVVSVDYSLAPENPFPRPTEEVLYAYAWILNNPEKLGWTGEKIVMVGDSAGGNLVVSTNLRLIELDIARRPNGLVLIYTPFLFQYLPSPSRILSFMDPLLHMGVVIRCAAAYTSAAEANASCTDFQLKTDTKDDSAGESLEDYVSRFQRAQEENRLDFSKHEETIRSLLNMTMGSDASQYVDQVSFSFQGAREDDAKNSTTTEETVDSDEQLSNGMDESALSAQVDADPAYIRLSGLRKDPDLLGFLKTHPLTANAFDGAQGDEDEVFAQTPAAFSAATTATTGGLLSKFFATPVRLIKFSRSDSRLTSSVGHTPHPKMRQRSLSQSIVDKATTFAGRAYDSLSEWIETSSQPVGHLNKKHSEAKSSLGICEDHVKAKNGSDSHVADLIDLKLPRDHLISPMYTSSDTIRQLPPVHFVGCHLDPLLDDTITFAKKLRNAGGKVRSVDLLDGVPHGFLNFAPMSAECRQGSDLCLQRLKEALETS